MSSNLKKNLFYLFTKLSHIRVLFQKGVKNLPVPEYARFSAFAILTGALAGISAVLFHEAIIFFTELSFRNTPKIFYIIVPAVGMLVLSLMTMAFPKTAKKKGISEVIKAVAIRGGYIPFRTTLFHFIAPAICIGTGNTLGPEGPVAQLGGGISSKFGNLLGLSDSKRRVFTAAGAGAAISAVFNSPLGGIFFALEIILLNDFQTPTFSALVLASVTASAISRAILGNHAVFIFDELNIGAYSSFYLYVILGIVAGFLSLLFIHYSDFIEKLFAEKILKKVPKLLVMVIVGLLMGISGYFFNGIFGIGYEAINNILAGKEIWDIVLILVVLKFILVPLILYSGGFGGLFAPTLFIGAGVGYLFAFVLNYFWGVQLDTSAYVLVGMGAMLGGVNTIPITAILVIFEMTQNYTFILPLMLAVIISTTIVQIFLKGSSIHVKHLEREGYKISSGRDTNILRSIFVADVMKNDILLIPENTSISKLISMLLESPHSTFYTVNKEGNLVGTITENELRPIITVYEEIRDTLVASDIAKPGVVTVFKSDNLDHIFNLFGTNNVDRFPVVTHSDPLKPIGTIWRQDVITAYNRESLKHNLTDGLANEIKSIQRNQISKVAEGYSIVETAAPSNFVGKSLAELRLRNKYGLEVLMNKKNNTLFDEEQKQQVVVPDPNYTIQTDDILVLFGSDENIAKTENWK